MIIGRSLTPLNSSKAVRGVRRLEMVRRDDNSRRKMQNVRGDSSDGSARGENPIGRAAGTIDGFALQIIE